MADIKVRVFFSYSHQDEELRDQLASHLKPLERQGKIETWHDRKIDPGIDWRQELDFQLNSADIILLLVSSSFVDSDFCYCTELEQARARHDAKEARIIPIFLRPIDLEALEGTPLQTLQGVPEPTNPITKWEDRDEAFTSVARSIRKVVNEIYQQKEAQQAAQTQHHRQSPMRSRVPDEHYIQRDEAKRLLDRFAGALKKPQGQPLLFNICGIGGVGKTTLLGRLQEAHAGEVDFLEVCFAKTAGIETPLKLMRKLHQEASVLLGVETSTDAFGQRERQFETTLFALSQKSMDGGAVSSEDARKITSWFERFIWLGPTGVTSTSSKAKSFEPSVSEFSTFAAIGEDSEGLQEWIQQRVRNHPATKDQPELQALMLEPVPRLTQAFAESLIQIVQSRGRSLVLILDTYEKAQAYLNQWLWQYLVEDTPLSSAPVRLVVVGRRSLQTDEGWRKLNQDRKLLHETQLSKFSKKDTEGYLQKIGIDKGSTCTKIYKATQGLPYYLDWVRKQREEGKEPDFSQGNQAIAKLLLQGINSQQQKILQVVACCRWFDQAMIRYLLDSDSLGLQQDIDNAENYFEWLKQSDFVEFTKGHYRLDDVARDVFRQSYFVDDQNRFRKTHVLLADYFKRQADEVIDPQSLLPDPYEDEEWRGLIAESLYYSLFGKGKQGLQQYIEHVFTAVYLREPNIFMTPFTFINAEINKENQYLLPQETYKFFKISGIALSFGWLFLGKPPKSYKLKFKDEDGLSEEKIEAHLQKLEDSLQALLGYVGNLQDGFGRCVGLIYKSFRCNRSKEKTDSLLQAKSQAEQLLTYCRPKLAHSLFLQLGQVLSSIKRYEDSLDCCKKVIELEQDNPFAFLGQGSVLFQLERYEEALESFQKAIDIDPEFTHAWGGRGAALANLDQDEEALESFQKAIDIDPKHFDSWINRGIVLKKMARYEEALKGFQEAIDIDSKVVSAWINQGNILGHLERYEEALQSYQKAIDIDSKAVSAWIYRGNILGHLERYEEALESYQKAIDIVPKAVSAWIYQGRTFNHLERYEKALESYQKAIDIDPKVVGTWIERGDTLLCLNQYEDALKSYQKAIDLNPKSADSLNNRSHLLLILRRYDEALADCNKAFEIDSKNLVALNSQALTLSFIKDFETALIVIGEAINLAPQDVLFKANRGIILARASLYTEALAACEQAIKQEPQHESGYYAKACYHCLQGETEQAIDNLQKAIDIAPRRSRREAKYNPDFDNIRDDERFRALVYLES